MKNTRLILLALALGSAFTAHAWDTSVAKFCGADDTKKCDTKTTNKDCNSGNITKECNTGSKKSGNDCGSFRFGGDDKSAPKCDDFSKGTLPKCDDYKPSSPKCDDGGKISIPEIPAIGCGSKGDDKTPKCNESVVKCNDGGKHVGDDCDHKGGNNDCDHGGNHGHDGGHCGQPVPEPMSIATFTAGFGALISRRRRRSAK